MSTEGKHSKLIATKLALAKKYENLAATASSKPRKARILHHVARFRRQAADLSRQ